MKPALILQHMAIDGSACFATIGAAWQRRFRDAKRTFRHTKS
jgi:hypothetical protein